MKKCISLLIIAILFITSLIDNLTLTTHADELSKVGLYLKKDVQDGVLLSFMGAIEDSDFNPGYVVYKKDGIEYPAYCIEPNVHGVKAVGEYFVDISEIYSNKQAYGAILNGYPFKVRDNLTEYENYYATQIAVWTIVHDYYGTDNIGEWKPYPDVSDTRVLDAMLDIRTAGLATTSIPTSNTTIAKRRYRQKNQY